MAANKTLTWMGRPLEDLTREELIEALGASLTINEHQKRSYARNLKTLQTLRHGRIQRDYL